MTTPSNQARAIFLEAIDQDSPENRADVLERACEGNPDLRARVERLLQSHELLGSFHDDPPPGAATVDGPLAERPGTVIGPYKLLQQIGEGGMGVVFMAEQTEPLQRTVALKIIKPGMDTRQVIARFEAERQALALMDHPNIARVLDAGTTGGGSRDEGLGTRASSGASTALDPRLSTLDHSSGRPYFVMDLVKGIPITDYCDAQHLSVRQRLELFTQVCHAVQHAHQKGIIHRDLKPSNVLVAEYDGRPVPKVIDFGVAKATAQKLTERTMFTQYGQIVGTFEYMSPEQARFNQLDVDTRSDIYSLGVLLYELLAGSTPFEKQRLETVAFDETLRIIREEEPPKPSTRLSSLSQRERAGVRVSPDSASIAANRHTEPAKLCKELSGDLDWIVMKCLEKDRNRRYESAIALAVDIRRHRTEQPVEARPPSAAYRFGKFARRNRTPLAFGVVTVVPLVLAACAIIGFQVRREREAHQLTQSAWESLAAAEAFYESGDFKTASEKAAHAADLLAKAARSEGTLELAIRRLSEQASAKHRAQEKFQEFQRLRDEIYSSVDSDSRKNEAIDRCRTALKLYQLPDNANWKGLIDVQNLDPNLQADLEQQTMELVFSSALLEIETTYDLKARNDALRRAIDILRRFERLYHPIRASQLLMESWWQELGEEKLARDAAQKAKSLEPGSGLDHFLLAQTYLYQYERNKADQHLRLAVRQMPGNYRVLERFGVNLGFLEREELAEAIFTGAIAVNPRATYAYYGRGQACKAQGKFDLALADFQKLAELNPRDYLAYVSQGQLLRMKGDAAQAVAMLDRAAELATESFWTRLERGLAYSQLGEDEKAIADFTQVIDMMTKLFRERPHKKDEQGWLTQAYTHRAACYARAGRTEEALADLTRAAEAAINNPQALNSLAWLLVTGPEQIRDAPRAVELAKRAVELEPNHGHVWNTLGVAHYRAGEFERAIETLQRSLELRDGGDCFDWFFLAMSYWKLDQKDEARQWYEKAVAWIEKNSPSDEELLRFRAEAAELIGLTTLSESESTVAKATPPQTTNDKQRTTDK